MEKFFSTNPYSRFLLVNFICLGCINAFLANNFKILITRQAATSMVLIAGIALFVICKEQKPTVFNFLLNKDKEIEEIPASLFLWGLISNTVIHVIGWIYEIPVMQIAHPIEFQFQGVAALLYNYIGAQFVTMMAVAGIMLFGAVLALFGMASTSPER